MSKLRCAVISPWDFDDSASWSGVVYRAVRALEKYADIERIHVPEAQPALADRALAKASGAFGKAYIPGSSFISSTRDSLRVREQVKGQHFDAYISLAASTSTLALPSDTPLIQVTDSSFRAMEKSYYPNGVLSLLSSVQGLAIDRFSAARSSYYSVASRWSAEMLQKDTRIPADRILVNPFGPGIVPERARTHRGDNSVLRLLFISSPWERKGGDIVLQIVSQLRSIRPVELTIVGKVPVELPEWVNHYPSLAPTELSEQYLSHDILLEMTRGSAGGVVVTDAIAHSLPVLATAVGGMMTLVRPGINGWLVAPVDPVEDAVEILGSISQEELQNLSDSTREYAQELTWDHWAQNILKLI